MEERTRQMKLKMNKYKPGAGSDSRLEQDYHKVPNCGCASLPTAAANTYLRRAVCAEPRGAFCKSGVYTRAQFNDLLRSYADNTNKNIAEQEKHSKGLA